LKLRSIFFTFHRDTGRIKDALRECWGLGVVLD
jgi:hypothetical protein